MKLRPIQFIPFFVVLMVSLLASSCDSDAILQGEADAIDKQDLTLSPFDTLEIHDNLQVILAQADQQEVRVEGLQKQLTQISAEVSNGKLVLKKQDNQWKADEPQPVKVYIASPSLKYIYFKGYGTLKSQDSLRFENLTLAALNAYGTVRIAVKNKRLKIISNSSASLQIEGSTDLLYCSTFYNDGIIDASDLNARSAYCFHHGESTIELKASQSLRGVVSNVGNLEYHGNPSEIEVEITGQGKLIHAN